MFYVNEMGEGISLPLLLSYWQLQTNFAEHKALDMWEIRQQSITETVAERYEYMVGPREVKSYSISLTSLHPFLTEHW